MQALQWLLQANSSTWSTNLEFHIVSWHLNKIWNPKSRTNTNTLIFSPSRHSKPQRTRWCHHKSLSRKVYEFLVFWFTLCCVLGLRGVFVIAGLEVGYRNWQKHTTSGLSDTFQTTSRQSDFRPNHRWVKCNYPFALWEMICLQHFYNKF